MTLKYRLTLLVPALLGLVVLGGGLITLQGIHKTVQATAEPVVEQPKSIAVLASNGALLRPFTTPKGYWRIPVALDEVDPRLIDFLLAYEDQRFFEHDGIDRKAMARAAGQLLLNGRIVSGASTLTMQVARLLSDRSTRNAAGKIRQMTQARMLEQRFSKNEILQIYLNHAPYGGNLEGVRAASWAYFGKEPKWLNLAEIALLIALPQAPEARRPDRHYENAFAARKLVLDRLLSAGLIVAVDADRAANAPLPQSRKSFPMLAPHVAQELKNSDQASPIIPTTIDYDLQASLEAHVTQRSAGLGKGFSIAVLVVDHSSGNVRASVGGPGLLSGNAAAHMNMIRAVRSPGSTLKPMIYGLGFEAGIAHPNTMIDDRPAAFADYVPENFDTGFHGSMTISEALQRSLNIPAVAVLDKVDPHRLSSRLRRAGAVPKFPQNTKPGLAMGLGGVGLTLEELVHIYGAIARGGGALDLHVQDDAEPRSSARVLSEHASTLLTKAMQQKNDRHHSQRGNLIYKTGTSYGYRDAWTLGFDGQHVVGVWVGRPDNAPASHITGATAALPIFLDVFARMGTKPHPALGGDRLVANSSLPAHLKVFGKTNLAEGSGTISRPIIAFPRSGTQVQLQEHASLAIKVRGGSAPFTWLADGKPIARKALRRESLYHPEGLGFSTLTVIDAKGQTDQISFRLTN